MKNLLDRFRFTLLFLALVLAAYDARSQASDVQVVLLNDTNRSTSITQVAGDFSSTNASGHILIAATSVTASYSWTNLQGLICHSNGTLVVQCQGTNAGTDYPQIRAQGVYLGSGYFGPTFNSTLNFQAINGFIPQVGDTFLILRYGIRQGVWPRVIVPTPPTNGLWEISYTEAGVSLTVTPKEVQPTLQITSATASSNLQFRVQASLGQTQILEYSTNLVDWVPALTNATYHGWLEFRKQVGLDSTVAYRIKQIVQ